MRLLIKITACLMATALLASGSVYAKKTTRKGVSLAEFPSQANAENLYINGGKKAKKVKKVDTVCVGSFTTSFNQQAVVQVRDKQMLTGGKMRAAAGRRLTNVEADTRQAITDDAYAYAREALSKAGFTVKSDDECKALKKWNKLKVSDKADGEVKKLGIFSGTLKIPTGATHAARHTVTGRPDYLSFAVSPLGDTTNNMVKAVQLAKKQKVGLVDFAFALDFNVNAASAEVSVSSNTVGYTTTTTTTKKWDFDFTDALFVVASGATYVNTKFKTAMWNTGPQYTQTFPAFKDTSYITGFEENNNVWDKRINKVNFDLQVDQAKYKAIYIKTLKAYIDVYVAQMAALKPM